MTRHFSEHRQGPANARTRAQRGEVQIKRPPRWSPVTCTVTDEKQMQTRCWCNHRAIQYGGSSKTSKWNVHRIQQFQFGAHTRVGRRTLAPRQVFTPSAQQLPCIVTKAPRATGFDGLSAANEGFCSKAEIAEKGSGGVCPLAMTLSLSPRPSQKPLSRYRPPVFLVSVCWGLQEDTHVPPCLQPLRPRQLGYSPS